MMVADDEILARFIVSKRDYTLEQRAVRPRAFLPYRGETSVFRTHGLSDAAVWQLAADHVEPSRGRCLARGDLRADMVRSTPLTIDADDSPLRHAVIAGWPDEKQEQLALALELAASAVLFVRAG